MDIDSIVVNICKKIGVKLIDDDIFRFYFIGKLISRWNIWIIFNLKNWKVKNIVYLEKCKLKKILVFVIEDLIKFCEGLV